jgi:Pyruvate/2-oxoacid:ferredoxin oxidoreductase delta subunit
MLRRRNLVSQTDAYHKLAERYGAPDSTRFINILETTVTPEESDLLLELGAWTTPEQLAKKLNTGEAALLPRLEELKRKRVVRSGKLGYAMPPNLMGLCHGTVNLSPKTDELWTDFFYAEWRYIIAESQHKRRLTGKWSVHRILPALQALAASPNIKPEQILWYENLETMLRRSKEIVFVRCVCRAQYHTCTNKVELCLHVTLDDGKSEPMTQWANLKHYTAEEAVAELYAAEDAGLVHLSLNHPRLEETCNCCEDCCRVINPLICGGKDYDLMDPSKSRFMAVIDEEKCCGCQTCVERCHFNAIEMKKAPGSKKMKAYLTNKLCMGCGLCVYKCPQKAIRLEIVRPPSFIPDITRDQALSWGPGF